MSDPTFPLAAYLDRIGHSGPCDASLDTLSALHERHACAIPFENIDVVLDRPIALDVPSLVRKLVEGRRGGYCFEHNGLFLAALRALGFDVAPLLARVRWQVPPGVVTPQTHMALRVRIDGHAWLADAGFGGIGLMAPLSLEAAGVQTTRFEPRRLVPHGRNLLQQVQIAGTWQDVYVLHLDEAYPIDFEVANWFTSAHPASRFRQNLMAARADGLTRYALFNREFSVRSVDGSVRRRTLATLEELNAVLDTEFRIDVPPGAVLACAGLAWD